MNVEFNHIKNVSGELKLPGDKSISHRVIFLSAMAKGNSEVVNVADNEDVKSTIDCLRALGVTFTESGNSIIISGRGYKGFVKPDNILNANNSGTTARFLLGLLSAQDFHSSITGDESLNNRPMNRIKEPLSLTGSIISLEGDNYLPAKIYPSHENKSIDFDLPIGSAQLKTALILKLIHSEDESYLTDKFLSRNHTELLLNLPVDPSKNKITVSKRFYPEAKRYIVPGDLSTAAFFIVLTLLSEDSELLIKNISLNESRCGFIEVCRKMGGYIEQLNLKCDNNEFYGDLLVKSSRLKNIKIDKDLVPNIIDEIPILSIAGIFAEGDFEIRNVKELRYKESDRIISITSNLKSTGLIVEESEDGFCLKGEMKQEKYQFNSFNDHRIAMSLAILSLLLKDGSKVNNFGCVNISNPKFMDQIKNIVR